MTKYTLMHILSENYKQVVTDDSLLDLLDIKNHEDAKKIVAAQFYALEVKKYKKCIDRFTKTNYTTSHYQEELRNLTKQFLEETPEEFLRLNYFKVVEK